MGNATLFEKFQALSSSVLLNFLPVALGVGLLCYLVSSLSLLIHMPYRLTVRWTMNLLANLLTLAVTAMATKILLLGQHSTPPLIKWLTLGAVVILTLWFTAQGIFLPRYMVLPRWLALISLPLAFGFAGQEILNKPKPLPESLTVVRQQGRQVLPDIILVTMDACTSYHLSGYGCSRPTSPNLDFFAQHGVVFERFYANANWTRPGIASLLNGARPWSHAGDLGQPRKEVTEGQNLPGCLARAGYDVRTVSSNGFADHAWQRTPVAPADQALVDFNGGPSIVPPPRLTSSMFSAQLGPLPWVRRLFGSSPTRDKTSYPLALAKNMLEKTPSGRPSFFWIHFLQPHDPYATADSALGGFEPSSLLRDPGSSGADYLFSAQRHPERQRILEGRYDEAILSVDGAIGDLIGWLKAQGRFDNSLIAISSDHGESFAHGYGGHGGPLLTEDLIRVPLIIKLPGQKNGEREARLFEQADLAPTLLHLVGLPIPSSMEGQPYPLKPDGVPVFAMNRDLSSSSATFNLAMRQGNWKYVTHFGKWGYPWPQRELYDLEQDPNENNNLVDRRADVAGPMHQRILTELAKRGLKPEAP